MQLLLAAAAAPNPLLEGVRLLLSTSGLLTLIAGIVWIAWIIRAVRRDLARHRQGRCLQCGYDLRHCHDRCSECGSAIRRPAQSR
jgi:hypothetical protein